MLSRFLRPNNFHLPTPHFLNLDIMPKRNSKKISNEDARADFQSPEGKKQRLPAKTIPIIDPTCSPGLVVLENWVLGPREQLVSESGGRPTTVTTFKTANIFLRLDSKTMVAVEGTAEITEEMDGTLIQPFLATGPLVTLWDMSDRYGVTKWTKCASAGNAQSKCFVEFTGFLCNTVFPSLWKKLTGLSIGQLKVNSAYRSADIAKGYIPSVSLSFVQKDGFTNTIYQDRDGKLIVKRGDPVSKYRRLVEKDGERTTHTMCVRVSTMYYGPNDRDRENKQDIAGGITLPIITAKEVEPMGKATMDNATEQVTEVTSCGETVVVTPDCLVQEMIMGEVK